MTTHGDVRQLFLNNYRDQYDFLYHNLDRGLTLQVFIVTRAADHTWMFNEKKPETFYDIPEAIRDDYKNYLLEVWHSMYGTEGDYSLEDAIADFSDINQ